MSTAYLKETTQLVLIKPEVTYGTDATPDGSNAIMVSNINVKPEFDKADRNNITGFMGAQGAVTVGQKVSVDFEVELVGSGTAGTAPVFAPVLLASGLAETVTAATSVEYTPIDNSFDSVTLYWRVGAVQHAVVGLRGNVALTLSTAGIPMLKFTGMGIYTDPISNAAAVTGVDFSTAQTPVGVYKDSVTQFTLFGSSLEMKSLDMDMGNDVQYSNLVNSESVDIVGRNGNISSGFRITEDQYVDFMNKGKTDATGSMAYALGATAGKILEIEVPNLQIKTSPSVSWDQGMAHLSVEADIVPTTANSDFTITFK